MLKEFIKKWGLETPDDPERTYDATAARQCLVELHKMGIFPSMQDFRNNRPGNVFFYLADLLLEAKLKVAKEKQMEEARKRYDALSPEKKAILDDHPNRWGWFMGTHRLPGVDF